MTTPKKPTGPTGKQRVLFPVGANKAYEAELLRRVRLIHTMTKELIDGLRIYVDNAPKIGLPPGRLRRFDGPAPVVRLDNASGNFLVRAVTLYQAKFEEGNPPDRRALREYAEQVDKHSAKAVARLMGTRGVAAVEVFLTESDKRLFDVFVSVQVERIGALDAKYFDDARKVITETFQAGLTTDDLARKLEERFGVSREKAKLIAENEIGTLNAKVNQLRQTRAGVSRFRWSTSNDERVRPEHEAIDGEIFTWSEGHPTEGRPGEPIRCRCTALPVFDGEY